MRRRWSFRTAGGAADQRRRPSRTAGGVPAAQLLRGGVHPGQDGQRLEPKGLRLEAGAEHGIGERPPDSVRRSRSRSMRRSGRCTVLDDYSVGYLIHFPDPAPSPSSEGGRRAFRAGGGAIIAAGALGRMMFRWRLDGGPESPPSAEPGPSRGPRRRPSNSARLSAAMPRAWLAAHQHGILRRARRRPGQGVVQPPLSFRSWRRRRSASPRLPGCAARAGRDRPGSPSSILDLADQVVEPPLRARQALVGAHDADVIHISWRISSRSV